MLYPHSVFVSPATRDLSFPRLFFCQSQSVPEFSNALPPENLALPLSSKPGLVTISFRHKLSSFVRPVF